MADFSVNIVSTSVVSTKAWVDPAYGAKPTRQNAIAGRPHLYWRVVKGSTIELRGVNFASNSDRLLWGAEQVLDDAIEWLGRNPHLQVEIAGHTDSDGPAAVNLGLSERRALTVRDYLINGGISASRLATHGYGETEPVADNSTTEGKAENRRVELRILNNRQ